MKTIVKRVLYGLIGIALSPLIAIELLILITLFFFSLAIYERELRKWEDDTY